MTTTAPGFQPFRESLQLGLNLYSSSFTDLIAKGEAIDANKGKWTRSLKDLGLPNTTQYRKELVKNASLETYDTLVKAKESACELFNQLNSIYNFCKRPPLSEEAYSTILGLEEQAPKIREKEASLFTVNGHIKHLATRVCVVLKEPIEERLPQAAQELDALIKYIDYGTVETRAWNFLKNYVGSTPNLAKSYSEWLEKKQKNQSKTANVLNGNIEEKKNSQQMDPKLPSQTAPVKEPINLSEYDAAYYENLDKALKNLNLTYVNPETLVRYGLQSTGADPRSSTLSPPNNSLEIPKPLESQTSSISIESKTGTATLPSIEELANRQNKATSNSLPPPNNSVEISKPSNTQTSSTSIESNTGTATLPSIEEVANKQNKDTNNSLPLPNNSVEISKPSNTQTSSTSIESNTGTAIPSSTEQFTKTQSQNTNTSLSPPITSLELPHPSIATQLPPTPIASSTATDAPTSVKELIKNQTEGTSTSLSLPPPNNSSEISHPLMSLQGSATPVLSSAATNTTTSTEEFTKNT